MPQLANISINDGKTTPLAHVFSPQTSNGSEAVMFNRAATIPQGYESLVVTVRGPGTSKTAAHRISGSITLPVVGIVDGQDNVVRSSKLDFVFSLGQLSTLQERKDILALASNLFANAVMKTVVENVEPLY